MFTFKWIAIVVTVLTAYAATFLAAKVAASKGRDRIFSLGNALAGGIFLGTGMLHILPDAHEGVKLMTGRYSLPWVTFLASCGFLLVLFFQRVLMYEEKALEDSVVNKTGRKLSPKILMYSLSLHSLVAGVALGTEEALRKALVLFIAILAYKLSAVFTLEVNLHRLNLHKNAYFKKMTSFFGFVTPVGILIGLALTAVLAARTERIVTIAFDALTAGSFLYIAFADILEEEFMNPKDRLLKFGLVTFGFLAMAIITLQV